jgi:hypothetical protein
MYYVPGIIIDKWLLCDIKKQNINFNRYQKGVSYKCIKLFNNFPSTIKSLNHNVKAFNPTWNDCLPAYYPFLLEKFTLIKKSLTIVSQWFWAGPLWGFE